MWLAWLMMSFFTFASALAWLWLQWSTIRYINQWKAQWKSGKIRSLYEHILKFTLPVAAIWWIIIYFSSNFIAIELFNEPRLWHLMRLMAISFPLLVLAKTAIIMLKWFKDIKNFNIIEKIIKQLARLTVLIVIFLWSKSIYWPAYAQLIMIIVVLVFCIPHLRKFYTTLPQKIPASATEIIKTSLPMMVTAMSFIIISQTDIIMLWIYSDTAEVWIYQWAYRFAKLVPFWLAMVNVVQTQKIAELYWAKKMKKLQKTLDLWSWIWFFSWLIIAIIFISFPNFWMSILGDEFITWSLVLQLIVVWQLINTISWSTTPYLNVTWKQKVLQWIVLTWWIINIFLNVLLIPKYWSTWAAISSIISIALWNGIAVIYAQRKDWIRTYFWKS